MSFIHKRLSAIKEYTGVTHQATHNDHVVQLGRRHLDITVGNKIEGLGEKDEVKIGLELMKEGREEDEDKGKGEERKPISMHGRLNYS